MQNKKTLNEIIEEWLQFKKVTLKESTYYRYIYIINQYIIPFFENMEMEKFEDYDFNIFVAELMKKLKPASIKTVITILKQILAYSRKKYRYKYDFSFVSIPKAHKKEIRILSVKEKQKLEKYCLKKNTLKHIGIIICLNTGLRVGEICALKWNCIDLERKVLKVEYTIQRIYNKTDKTTKIIIDRPKSENSVRTIPISSKLYNILKPMKKQYVSNSYFLTGSAKKYVEPRTYQRMFENCAKVCNIKDFHFHRAPSPFCERVCSHWNGHKNIK